MTSQIAFHFCTRATILPREILRCAQDDTPPSCHPERSEGSLRTSSSRPDSRGLTDLWQITRRMGILPVPCTEVTWHPQGMSLHFIVSLYQCTVYFLDHCPLWRGDMSSKLSIINTVVQTVWRATR